MCLHDIWLYYMQVGPKGQINKQTNKQTNKKRNAKTTRLTLTYVFGMIIRVRIVFRKTIVSW